MLKNYIITAINNLFKNKLYSAINIIGLAVGLATCILISLYVQNELSYDRHWEKADLIYRINRGDVSTELNTSTSFLTLPALKKFFPNVIEFGTRITEEDEEIQIGDKRYQAKIARVDKDFINIFKAEELKGSLKSTIQSSANIALSEDYAKKYFGDIDPINEVITLDNEPYKVTAVYRLLSPNTVLKIPCFSLFDDSKLHPVYLNWNVRNPQIFIQFYDTAATERFIKRLPDFIDQNIPRDTRRNLQPDQKLSEIWHYSPQKLKDIYFNPIKATPDWQTRVGNRTVIAVYIIISALVLLIGSINFIILTTARATQRAREVAMRKVVGARFKQLFIQFLGESILITLFAFIISIAFIEMALPFFGLLMDTELIVPYTSVSGYLFIFILIISVGLLGGLYPAFILSKFSPAHALKNNQANKTGSLFKLRSILVVFQFSASIVLIIATAVTFIQLQYTSKHDPGFNPNNLLVVEGIAGSGIRDFRKTLQQELMKLPEVTNVGLSTRQPMELNGGFTVSQNYRPKALNAAIDEAIPIDNLFIDYNFFKTYEIPLLSGRYFSQDQDQKEPNPFNAPSENAVEIKDRRIVINMVAARQLGYRTAHEAIGQILESGERGLEDYTELTIIGVVEDTQYRDLRIKPKPEIYRLIPDTTAFLTVRYKGNHKTATENIKRVWHRVAGDAPFRESNVKQNLAVIFSREKRESKVLITFALLSVVIACMGLFGMASFTVDRRVKEIGMRKVMGAKVKDIVKLLGWNFLKPVLIANIIAWPVAIFAMQNWLERFPYRFNPLFMIPICLGSGFIAVVIAWLTVAGNTTRVAKSRPIKALRYE